jgi:hypothetical protein
MALRQWKIPASPINLKRKDFGELIGFAGGDMPPVFIGEKLWPQKLTFVI